MRVKKSWLMGTFTGPAGTTTDSPVIRPFTLLVDDATPPFYIQSQFSNRGRTCLQEASCTGCFLW